MSRLLQERHATLRADEVPLAPLKRAGAFRVALCYPNLYFVGMSNLGFQGIHQLFNGFDDVLCERAFLPDDVDSQELERSGRPLTSLESGTGATRLRRGGVLDLLRERLPPRPQDAAHRRASRCDAADRGPHDPLVRVRRLRDVPEPRAPGALRRPHRRGRGREPSCRSMMEALLGAHRPAARASTSLCGEGRLLRAVALRGALPPDGTVAGVRWPRAGDPPARLAGQDAAARSRSS